MLVHENKNKHKTPHYTTTEAFNRTHFIFQVKQVIWQFDKMLYMEVPTRFSYNDIK